MILIVYNNEGTGEKVVNEINKVPCNCKLWWLTNNETREPNKESHSSIQQIIMEEFTVSQAVF